MLRELRKNIARSVSDVNEPEVYPWNRWLKIPKTDLKKIEEFRLAHYDTSQLVLSIEQGNISTFKHKIYGGRLSEENLISQIVPLKCSRTFFGFATTKTEDVYVQFDKKGKIYFTSIVAQDRSEIHICNEYLNKKERVLAVTPETYAIASGLKESGVEQILNFLQEPEASQILYKIEAPQITTISYSLPETETLFVDKLLKYDENNFVSENVISTKSDNVYNTLTLIVDFQFEIPKTFFYPATYDPHIFNMDLLTFENTFTENSTQKSTNYIIDLLDTPPVINNIDLLDQSVKKTFFLRNINLSDITEPCQFDVPEFTTTVMDMHVDAIDTETTCLYQNRDEDTIESLSEENNKLYNKFNFLLQPNATVSNEYEKSDLLFNFQQEGIDFLTNNRFALFADQMGLGKKKQTLLALKEAMQKGKVKSALIICDSNNIGNSNDIIENLPSGWSVLVNKVLSGISTTQINGDIAQRESQWKNPSFITISGYKTLFEDLNTNLVNSTILNHFDCLIFDDAELTVNSEKEVDLLLLNSQPYYTWLLTSQPLSFVKRDLYQIFSSAMVQSQNTNRSLRRTEKDLTDYEDYNYPRLTREECWIPLDNNQQNEYNQHLINGVESLIDLMKNGNPYRFQANVFALLHQLKRITNCSESRFTGNKTVYFGRQAQIIKNENEQFILFTQYDKFGRQVVEDELNRREIKFEKFLAGMSPQQLQSALQKFETDKSITAFIYAVKPGRLIPKLPETRYVIHFDRWWNPATYWQLENVIEAQCNGMNSYNTKTIFSYLTPNTLDEKIELLLTSKNLTNKSLLDTLTPQNYRDLIQDKEWIELLVKHVKELNLSLSDISETEAADLLKNSQKNKIAEDYFIEYEDLKEKTSDFFIKLGYKAIEVRNGTPGIVEYTGINDQKQNIKFCAKSFFNYPVDQDIVTGFCESKLASDEFDRLYLILPDKAAPEHLNLPSDKISVVSKSSLVRYLTLFGL